MSVNDGGTSTRSAGASVGEPGAAVVVGGREQRLAVEVQHVEGVEGHREARAQLRRRMADVHAVLQQPEVRPARGVEHDDLAVEQDGPPAR